MVENVTCNFLTIWVPLYLFGRAPRLASPQFFTTATENKIIMVLFIEIFMAVYATSLVLCSIYKSMAEKEKKIACLQLWPLLTRKYIKNIYIKQLNKRCKNSIFNMFYSIYNNKMGYILRSRALVWFWGREENQYHVKQMFQEKFIREPKRRLVGLGLWRFLQSSRRSRGEEP